MHCPRCVDTTLHLSSRSDVEIDYCPRCRGVWLDRGELDKLIERSEQLLVGAAAPPADRRFRDRDDDDDDHFHERGRWSRKSKKKSLLSEIFDF